MKELASLTKRICVLPAINELDTVSDAYQTSTPPVVDLHGAWVIVFSNCSNSLKDKKIIRFSTFGANCRLT